MGASDRLETWRVQVAQAVKNGYAEDCEGFVEGVSTWRSRFTASMEL